MDIERLRCSDKFPGRIVQNPEVMAGKPVIAGTRMPVEAVLEHLASELDLAELLEAYPSITLDDVQACMAYAADLVANVERAR
jgi:uncharacterized protein (DUF433 family)